VLGKKRIQVFREGGPKVLTGGDVADPAPPRDKFVYYILCRG